MNNVLLLGICAFSVSAVACTEAEERSGGHVEKPKNVEDGVPKSIGMAKMTKDRRVEMTLRAETDDGTVGQGFFVYGPDHPNYRSVLEHLGGLAPGESKPVPPWPSAEE